MTEGCVKTGDDTDVLTVAAASRSNGDRPSLATLCAVLDVVRRPGHPLRVLEVSLGAGSLASLVWPDEVVRLDGAGWEDSAPKAAENAYDCAVAIDWAHRLEPFQRRPLLTRLRRAARAAVLVEAPRANGSENPFEDAIELFREFGDSVVVLGTEHLPALAALRDAAHDGEPAGDFDRAGLQAANGSRSVLVSIIDPDAVGVGLARLRQRPVLPSARVPDPGDVAVLSLSVEVRRLSERLDSELERRDRAEAEATDLRGKVAELTRIASEDRFAREAAEAQVAVVAAARGYRIGLALYHARAAVRRALRRVGRAVTAPVRAVVGLLRRDAAAPSGQ
jgi:hypothetical protein